MKTKPITKQLEEVMAKISETTMINYSESSKRKIKEIVAQALQKQDVLVRLECGNKCIEIKKKAQLDLLKTIYLDGVNYARRYNHRSIKKQKE